MEPARLDAVAARITEPAPSELAAAPTRHGHPWKLPDGTGLHAPPEVLVVDPDTGRLCCHMCGNWYRSLGSHVRAHGHTAETYRLEMGLCRGQALTEGSLSAAISSRQRDRYERSPEVQDWLADGRRRLPRG